MKNDVEGGRKVVEADAEGVGGWVEVKEVKVEGGRGGGR